MPVVDAAQKAKSSANLMPPPKSEDKSATDIQRIERGRSTRKLIAGLKAAKT